MIGLPEVVTHIYDPARGAFRNICALPRAEAQGVLDQIAASGKRAIKPNYLDKRLRTEKWLRTERARKLGPTPLSHPLYFFLGDFADGLDPSRPASVVIPLDALPAERLTFTYPDSMASLPLGTRPEHLAERRDCHGQVFTRLEIEAVVARHGMPGTRWQREPAWRYDRFIEVQFWDDRPLEQYWPKGISAAHSLNRAER